MVPHGRCTVVNPISGQLYEGYSNEGSLEGQGRSIFNKGRWMYAGDHKNDVQHGYGIRVTESGLRFEGLSVKGHAVKGKMWLPDGTIYDGELLEGEYHGEGHLTNPDGE